MRLVPDQEGLDSLSEVFHALAESFPSTFQRGNGAQKESWRRGVFFPGGFVVSSQTCERDSHRHPKAIKVDSVCRGIISYTSYSRTNDCIYNGYDNINLEPNAMINIDTVAHMNMHYTQY